MPSPAAAVTARCRKAPPRLTGGLGAAGVPARKSRPTLAPRCSSMPGQRALRVQLNLLRSIEPHLRRALQRQADPWGRQARRARPAHARAQARAARAAADARPARAAVLDEKAAAAQALGIYAAEARAVFAAGDGQLLPRRRAPAIGPYPRPTLCWMQIGLDRVGWDPSAQVTRSKQQAVRRQVRCQAYSALAHLVPATAAAYPGGPDGAGARGLRPRKRAAPGMRSRTRSGSGPSIAGDPVHTRRAMARRRRRRGSVGGASAAPRAAQARPRRRRGTWWTACCRRCCARWTASWTRRPPRSRSPARPRRCAPCAPASTQPPAV